MQARKEQEAAAREATAEVEGLGVARESGDSAPPNGFDYILSEVVEEAGCERDESNEEAW